MDKSGTVFYIFKIIYPNYHPAWFLIYMYLKYYSVLKRHTKYSIKTLCDSVLWNIVRNHPNSNCDINNCVIVHPDNLYPGDRILLVHHNDTKTSRKVIVIPELLCEKHTLCISNTLFHNDFYTKIDFDVRLVKSNFKVNFAQEIELSLIVSPNDINNAIIDKVIEGYFKLPKIICMGDVISISPKNFSEASFYADLKVNSVEKLYFKCNKVIFKGRLVNQEYFCAIGQTSIKQSANVQSFLPRVIKVGSRSAHRGVKCLSQVDICPYGLQSYLDKLDMALNPFIGTKNIKLRPVFLLQGAEGCGKDILINSLAAESGMHHFKINNADLSANVYAQNESKLNKVFFTAKMAAPCIVSIHKFENFGKNNEGQYDQRLISSFTNYLDNLFDNNPFPVILFCCSNSKNIPAEFKRMFLEIFVIEAPMDTEREHILKWVLEKNDIELQGVDLRNISNKTHGFYFKDLEALVYYTEKNFYKISGNRDQVVLEEEHFENAIEFMQSNYNESLGAPKVPKVQWSDVGGLTDVKEEIIKTINLPLKHPEMFKESGLTRSGILLFGPPGTGKTLIAKAVATECSLCFLTVKGPELLNMYIGQSEQNVREVFDRARQASPCIIFFDELDSLAPNRGLSGDSGGVMDRVVSQLLAEMDGLDTGEKVFVIGATNRPDLIDPALLRPGRFDKLLYVGPCSDLDSKTSVLQALTRKFRLAEEVELNKIVSTCPKNITGADFYGICSNAWSSAAKRLIKRIEGGVLDGLGTDSLNHRDVIVTIEDFMKAIENVMPSISEEDLKYFENLTKELTKN